MKKCFWKSIATFVVFISLFSGCNRNSSQAAKNPSADITIFYTNDVHTNLAKNVTYAKVSAMKKQLQKNGKIVFLVDAGDHVQGTAYGALNLGETIIKLMNASSYDVSAVGNHEFDYGFERFQENCALAEFTYVAANFFKKADHSLYFPSYKVFDAGNVKIAFVGVMTPETITKSSPAYFMDETKTKWLYEIAAGKNGEDLYKAVQNAVSEAKKEADIVIVLSHLGIDPSSAPYTSRDLIKNTTGVDALIDGHSHSIVENEVLQNRDGRNVVLTQTGSYFDYVGKMTIGVADGSIKSIQTELLDGEAIDSIIGKNGFDNEVQDRENQWIAQVTEDLGQTIALCDFDFCVNDTDGKRLIRRTETNLGDFIADSIYWYMNERDDVDCDIAIANGGGIRTEVEKGEWTYLKCKNVQPFGNMLCVVEITGRQILDMLEYSVRLVGEKDDNGDDAESGGFLHVAGMKFEIGAKNEMGSRVKDVMIYDRKSARYEVINEQKIYRIGGIGYTLRRCGDGYEMLSNLPLVKDYILEDYMAMASYAENFAKNANGVAQIASENSPLKTNENETYKNYVINYENRYGAARIVIK